MVQKHISVVALLLTLSQPVLAQDCTDADTHTAMARLQTFYQSDEIALFNTQLQVNAVSGRRTLTPDGKWGPNTAAQVCRQLRTYVVINGVSANVLVSSPKDVTQFVRWMGAMARFNLNPDSLEAPD